MGDGGAELTWQWHCPSSIFYAQLEQAIVMTRFLFMLVYSQTVTPDNHACEHRAAGRGGEGVMGPRGKEVSGMCRS